MVFTMETAAVLIDSAEACRILEVERSSLTRMVQTHRLSARGRLNGGYVFERHAVEALAAERSATASPALAGAETPAVTS